MKMATTSQRYHRGAELRQNEAEALDDRECCSFWLICIPAGLVFVCVCACVCVHMSVCVCVCRPLQVWETEQNGFW